MDKTITQSKTKQMLLVALTTAILCVISMLPGISLYFVPVPLTLQLIGVFLAPMILGFKLGTLSVLLYVVLGAAGLPVFEKMRGGINVILGPTGGYIIGFVFAAILIGLVHRYHRGKPSLPILIIAGVISLIPIHLLGVIQLSYVTEMDLKDAFFGGSLPFLPFDILKSFIAGFIAVGVRNRIRI